MNTFRYMSVFLLLVVATMVSAQDEASTTAIFEELQTAEPQYGVVEETITFENQGQTIVGTLALPDGGDSPYPVVLLFHGFKGERDELPIVGVDEGMYTRTARALAGQGYASLRLDFRGSGESEGDWADTTFQGQISDAIAALGYLETLDEIDSGRIGIIGLSQGGLVAAVTAQDPRVDTVVLWSAVANPPLSYTGILGPEVMAEGLVTEGELSVTLPWGEETSMRRPFFEDIYNIDPIAEISDYTGPLMVVGGERDTTVAPMPYAAEIYTTYHEGPEMLVMVDGDHVFDVLATGPEVLDEVITWSLAWLQQTL